MLLLDKYSKMKWHLIVVYGPTQNESKDHFLAVLADICHRCKGAVVIGGDFNIIRKTEEKNKPCVLPRWSHIFNAIIDSNGLKEVKLLGRKYTWANNLEEPTYDKLDRVLGTSEWDLSFPLAVVTGLNREISDHVPLLLNYGGSFTPLQIV